MSKCQRAVHVGVTGAGLQQQATGKTLSTQASSSVYTGLGEIDQVTDYQELSKIYSPDTLQHQVYHGKPNEQFIAYINSDELDRDYFDQEQLQTTDLTVHNANLVERDQGTVHQKLTVDTSHCQDTSHQIDDRIKEQPPSSGVYASLTHTDQYHTYQERLKTVGPNVHHAREKTSESQQLSVHMSGGYVPIGPRNADNEYQSLSIRTYQDAGINQKDKQAKVFVTLESPTVHVSDSKTNASEVDNEYDYPTLASPNAKRSNSVHTQQLKDVENVERAAETNEDMYDYPTVASVDVEDELTDSRLKREDVLSESDRKCLKLIRHIKTAIHIAMVAIIIFMIVAVVTLLITSAILQ